MPLSFLFLLLLLLINQNFAARLVLLAPVTTTLHLSWKIFTGFPLCIKYTDTCMRFNAINGSGPVYLSELQHVYTPSRTLHSSSLKKNHLPFAGKNKSTDIFSVTMVHEYAKIHTIQNSHLTPAPCFFSSLSAF